MGRVLDLQISVPGTKLLKSGDCFVQWRDTVQGGVWGLNFVSEADAYCFVKACTPSNRPPLHHTNSSVSLPLEPPPGVQLPPSPEDSGGYITDIDQLIAEDNDVFTSTPKENSCTARVYHSKMKLWKRIPSCRQIVKNM
uniref:Protein still life, isoform SIF type 1-like n=1 Tax=Saccoglossus kowalevskii TaxID=10224 RepID=A0ABM0MPX7_SACKO|nr:PREDICTED: protein still life, isoform SIF type 1-like [Saccoglossus kowalevskii]